mmetsp:Transcript_10743/g.29171  ORF Transcript_10743/g.29171 Transcript_10743/m.29171 type:complete len:291 (-) Transcript_10743:9-881(-)
MPPGLQLECPTHRQERQLQAQQGARGIHHLGGPVEAFQWRPARQVASVAPAPAAPWPEPPQPLLEAGLQPVHREHEPPRPAAVAELHVVLAGPDHLGPAPAAARGRVGVGAHVRPTGAGRQRVDKNRGPVLLALRVEVVLALQPDGLPHEHPRAGLVQEPHAAEEVAGDVGEGPASGPDLGVGREAQGCVESPGEERGDVGKDEEKPEQAKQLVVLWLDPCCVQPDAEGRIRRVRVFKEAKEDHKVQHVQPKRVHEDSVGRCNWDERHILPDEGDGGDGRPRQGIAQRLD